MSDEDSEEIIWSLDHPKELTTDERLEQVEEQAAANCEKEKADREERLRRLRNDRENADSRKSWQQGDKERVKINGQETKARRVFADPNSAIFGLNGKTNVFKTAEKRRQIDRFLGKELRSSVSSQQRKAYLGALECFKDNTGALSQRAVRKMHGLVRTGQAGTNEKTLKAVNKMKEKGIIKEVKDLRNLFSRGAERKMSDVLMRRDDNGLTPSRFKSSDSPRFSGGGSGPSSSRRP